MSRRFLDLHLINKSTFRERSVENTKRGKRRKLDLGDFFVVLDRIISKKN